MIRFGECIDGKWLYHFASHPRFCCWAYNILYQPRLLGQRSFFSETKPKRSKSNSSRAQKYARFRRLLKGDIKANASCQKKVSETNACWNQVGQDPKATISQIGAPAIFWTLSCVDFHWPEFHSMFSNNSRESETLRQNVIANPHILDWFFTQRTESFVKWWLYETLGALVQI